MLQTKKNNRSSKIVIQKMATIQKIIDLEKKEVIPTKEQKQKVKKIGEEFHNIFKKRKALKDVKIELSGSIAKDTWLPNKSDIDFSFAYPLEFNKIKISDLLEKELKKTKVKYKKLHGSRDYFKAKYKNFEFELIPIIKTKKIDQILNITDATPYHVKWVNKNSKKNKNEIRLFKKFCKCAKIYGAESHIKGFSGYVCEILVIKNKTFLKTLREISKWKLTKKIIIDVEKHHKKHSLRFFNKSKVQNPLVIVDPVDKDRNAAAAVSEKSIKKMIKLSKGLLKNPKGSYFESKDLTKKDIERSLKKDEEITVIKMVPKEGKSDVVGSSALKALKFFERELKSLMFDVVSIDYDHENFVGWIVTRKMKEKYYEHKGPRISDKKNSAVFRKKYRGVKTKKGCLVVKIKMKYNSPIQAAKSLQNSKYLKSKVKKVTIV